MTARLVDLLRANGTVLRPALFAVVGVVNTTVDLGIFCVLTGMEWLTPLPAHFVSFCVAAINSFVLNTLITFRDRPDGRWMPQRIMRFGLVAVFSLMLSTMVLAGLLQALPPIPAKLVSVVVMFAVSYGLNAVVVFNKP